MLAYLFWHCAADGVDPTRYEDALIAFHRALAERSPEGFVRSCAFRLDAVPWLDGRPGYEDRYLVVDSAALDPLNEAAVAAGMRVPHDAVAGLADDGAGGLYRLIRAAADPDAGPGEPSVAVWITKPRGAGYSALIAELTAAAPQGSDIWQRQMVLGPAPEFCVVGGGREFEPGRFPAEWSPVAVRRHLLTPRVMPR